MLNLLLREDRHGLRKEYFMRLSILMVSILIVLIIIWGIVLISPYSQVFVEKAIVEGQVEEIQNSDVSKEKRELRNLSRDIEAKIEYLSRSSIEPTHLLVAVLESQSDGIGLSEIGVQISDVEDQVIAHIEMRGIANSRNDLVIFQKSLLGKEVFNKVDIPFSNFAKDIEVPFTISISSVELEEYLENESSRKEKNVIEEVIEESLIEKEDNIEEDEE